jgi:hypothetical protein
MKAKHILALALFCALALVALLGLPHPALAGWPAQQLTDNDYGDCGPQIDGGRVVWDRESAFDEWGTPHLWEIYLYDLATGQTEQVASPSPYSYDNLQIDEEYVVWTKTSFAETDLHELNLYNVVTGQTILVASDLLFGYFEPQIDEGLVAWSHQGEDDGPVYDAEIYLYSVATGQTTRVTDNDDADYRPQVDGGLVVWERYDGNDHEICLYDAATGQTTQVTDNDYTDVTPQIKGGQVVWYGGSGVQDYEIYLYDLATEQTTQVTHNAYIDVYPETDGRRVVWESLDDVGATTSRIYLYDAVLNRTTQLDSAVPSYNYPQIDGGLAVWNGYDGDDREICLYNAVTSQTTQVTHNAYADYSPGIDGGRVVWTAADGRAAEIWLATLTVTIDDVLDYFEATTADGTLAGNPPGRTADRRLDRLRSTLLKAESYLSRGNTRKAISHLEAVYLRCDGAAKPPDLATGPAAPGLSSLIRRLIDDLNGT